MTNDITEAAPRLSVVIPMYNESQRMLAASLLMRGVPAKVGRS